MILASAAMVRAFDKKEACTLLSRFRPGSVSIMTLILKRSPKSEVGAMLAMKHEAQDTLVISPSLRPRWLS